MYKVEKRNDMTEGRYTVTTRLGTTESLVHIQISFIYIIYLLIYIGRMQCVLKNILFIWVTFIFNKSMIVYLSLSSHHLSINLNKPLTIVTVPVPLKFALKKNDLTDLFFHKKERRWVTCPMLQTYNIPLSSSYPILRPMVTQNGSLAMVNVAWQWRD